MPIVPLVGKELLIVHCSLQCPFEPVFGVFDAETEGGELVADMVGYLPLLVALGFEAHVEQQVHSTFVRLEVGAFDSLFHAESQDVHDERFPDILQFA